MILMLDGFVYISQLVNRYFSDLNKIVKLHQHIKVKVTEIDLAGKNNSTWYEKC